MQYISGNLHTSKTTPLFTNQFSGMLLNSWSVHMNGLKFCDIQIIFLTAFLSHM